MLPAEPLNYRRLLDKNVSCDWNFIVDKILWSNDQQASIFLQTKLKAGTTEQKFEIIETIIVRALDLMINRFGNFLVQRCLEHGTTDQVIAIASVFKGRTVMLSKDTFGCHVVQTAFNIVSEDIKAWMVHELLLGIEETIDHRYACHVWQKLFELRWTQTPPPIMARVNETLCGRWNEIALGETGSLVVQNIFENCVEEEKVSATCPNSYSQVDANDTSYSAQPSKRYWQRSMSSPMANLVIGASNTSVNMVPRLTRVELRSMFSFVLLITARISTRPRLLRNCSRLVAPLSSTIISLE